MRIKQSVVMLAITGSKNKHTIDQGGIGLHSGGFKKLVHFLRNSFFPVTKCGTKCAKSGHHCTGQKNKVEKTFNNFPLLSFFAERGQDPNHVRGRGFGQNGRGT